MGAIKSIDELDDTEMTRLIIRMRRRLAEAQRAIRRPDPDEDERGVIASILASLREIAAKRPHLAPKLHAIIAAYQSLASGA